MKALIIAALLAASTTLCGCATLGTPRTPAQVVADVCPKATAIVDALQSLQGLPPGAANDLATAGAVISTACAVGAQSAGTSAASLANDAIPVLSKVVSIMVDDIDRQNRMQLELAALRIILMGVQ